MTPRRKARQHPGRSGRKPPGSRRLRKRFLIFCEGAVTERQYFQSSPVSADVLVDVHGEGKSTKSLVQAARKHADAARKRGSGYDEVWIVYDKDDFSREQFNAAADMIQAEDQKRTGERWHAAWSNQAFELWYLLHFIPLEAALHRDTVMEKLGEQLRAHNFANTYQKNDPRCFNHLEALQEGAIRRAEELARRHEVPPYGSTPPAEADPCTLVYQLVKALKTV